MVGIQPLTLMIRPDEWVKPLLTLMVGLAFCMTSHWASAATVQHFSVSGSSVSSVGPSLVYMIDQEGGWKADDIDSQIDSITWQQAEGNAPNLGLLDSPVWFALHLNTEQDLARVLEISYPALNSLDIYLFQGGVAIQEVHTGSSRPFDSRPINHRNYIVPLALKAGVDYTLIMRVHTGGALQLPTMIWEPSAFQVADEVNFGMIMMFAGVMIAMAIYNLLLFTGVRDISYLWYVLTVIAIAWAQLSIRGVLFQYLWPEHPEINEIGLPMAIALNILSVAFFSERFLNIRQSWVQASRAVRGFGWLGGILMLFSLFVPYAVSIRPLIAVAFISSLVMFSLGIYLWIKGQVLARFYVIAWGLFLLGTASYSLNKAGLLPYTPLHEYGMMIGASLQVLLLSFALAYRINLERRRRLEAQALALETQRDANEQLEEKVKERTEELEVAYRELKLISQMDGLTKVKNRQCFDQELEKEWRRNSREVSTMSLLMLDADLFKNINDTWGHPCGDACLKYIANICKGAIQRGGDTVARYGGEEFVLLLPSTDLIGAAVVAERIRVNIANEGFSWQGKPIELTVSVGVASSTADLKGSYEELVQHADRALYAAKAGGRNCVMVYQAVEGGKEEITRYPKTGESR